MAVVVFDQISTLHLAAPCTIFGEPHPGVPPFEFRYCAADAGEPRSAAGLQFMGMLAPAALARADIVIVPGWFEHYRRPGQPLIDALQQASMRGATIVGLCLGTFVLADAGLLHHRRATTHWAYAGDLARRFPTVDVQENVLYTDDGGVLTSAGSGAALDCCLHLLGRLCGASVAAGLARRLVLSAHRQGHQAQVLAQPFDRTSKGARLSSLLDELGTTLATDHSIASVAMSERSFTRHFREITGTTLQRWLLAQRLGRAREMLEQPHTSIETISHSVGFGSPVSLRQSFRKAYGMSPTAWRKRHRSAARARPSASSALKACAAAAVFQTKDAPPRAAPQD